jgi:hypothetical protein
MTYLSQKDYHLIGFEESHRDKKKYNAVLENKKTKRIVKMPFGSIDHQQYKDNVLGSYSHLDHGDKERRKRFRSRHKGFLKTGYYSPSHFSFFYLW